ncbi:DUF4240 domain-containing protein [Kribbella sp. NPDC059898]|uniref:DUF4240 domain-containing protein n=1 Tax=Kribbella sp. NPDC059898 TaxID=3346995 RepID=UPI003658A1EC
MWAIVGRGDVSSEQAVELRLEEVRTALETLPESRLATFQRWLAARLFDIDRRAYAEVPARLSDGSVMDQSADFFLYARCACVLSGEERWTEMLEGNASFSAFTSTASQGAESLLYLALDVSEERFGRTVGATDGPSYESGSNSGWW